MISIFCIIAGFTCCCTSIAAELIKHTKYKHLLRLRPDITPTFTDKLFKSCFNGVDLKIMNSVLASYIFNLFKIIHRLISEIHKFIFPNACNGSSHLKET